jgi:hypothetical protein
MSDIDSQEKIKLFIGSTALIVGVVATGIAMFRWTENTTTIYLLGYYSKYVCAFGGILASIIGLMIIKEYWQRTASSENAI